MRLAFMGTPAFAARILQALADAGHEIALVVTQPDRPRDRGRRLTASPVKERATALGVPVAQPDTLRRNQAFYETLWAAHPALIVVASYGKILPAEILSLPPLGCVNVHASLLPKFRGASPIQHAILEGETVTGVTLMQMEAGLDTGPMFGSAEVPIGDRNAAQLEAVLAETGARLLTETLPAIEAGTIRPLPQDDSQATYAGLLKKSDGRVDFTKAPAAVERQIRAFDPWPGAFCQRENGTVLKLWGAAATDVPCDEPPGTVLGADATGLSVSCGGLVLRITELQAPGKRRLSAGEFLRGHGIAPGERLL